jgi:mono/diheme cytochrome c family protein
MLENRSASARLMRIALCCAMVAALLTGSAALRSGGKAEGGAQLSWGPGPAFAAQAIDGQRLYNTLCAACHQVDGNGLAGLFPPIAGSEWVTGDEGRLIRVILHGLTGEIRVGDRTYTGTMPPFGAALSDAEVAALATYIRSNFGNRAPAIDAAAVERVRTAAAARRTPWTQQELDAELGRQ